MQKESSPIKNIDHATGKPNFYIILTSKVLYLLL